MIDFYNKNSYILGTDRVAPEKRFLRRLPCLIISQILFTNKQRLVMPKIKSIPNFPGYFADKNGNVYSSRPINGVGVLSSEKRLLKQKIGTNGYKRLTLMRNKSGVNVWVHRLILETFVGKPPSGTECCHNDGNPTNNNLSNLRWDTRSANALDMLKHGVCYFKNGEEHPNSKLNELQVRIILKYPQYHGCMRHLSYIFNVSISSISLIRTGKSWRHVSSESK